MLNGQPGKPLVGLIPLERNRHRSGTQKSSHVREAPIDCGCGDSRLASRNLLSVAHHIKPAAATPRTSCTNRGRAVVFDSIEDMHARIDDPDLDVDVDSVLVLQGLRPRAIRECPKSPTPCVPSKLLSNSGVRDMVRVCERAHERHRVRNRECMHVTPKPRWWITEHCRNWDWIISTSPRATDTRQCLARVTSVLSPPESSYH